MVVVGSLVHARPPPYPLAAADTPADATAAPAVAAAPRAIKVVKAEVVSHGGDECRVAAALRRVAPGCGAPADLRQ